ncbi:helix-turn-helix domain-containing protein [Roseovarius sp. MBR-51]
MRARLLPYNFARLFKQNLGVPPWVHLTRLRKKKGCELLEHANRPITQIVVEVVYSSNQVLARAFLKPMRLSPSDDRRARCDSVRLSVSPRARAVLEGRH